MKRRVNLVRLGERCLAMECGAEWWGVVSRAWKMMAFSFAFCFLGLVDRNVFGNDGGKAAVGVGAHAKSVVLAKSVIDFVAHRGGSCMHKRNIHRDMFWWIGEEGVLWLWMWVSFREFWALDRMCVVSFLMISLF